MGILLMARKGGDTLSLGVRNRPRIDSDLVLMDGLSFPL
jgi:hypothetical protein